MTKKTTWVLATWVGYEVNLYQFERKKERDAAIRAFEELNKARPLDKIVWATSEVEF